MPKKMIVNAYTFDELRQDKKDGVLQRVAQVIGECLDPTELVEHFQFALVEDYGLTGRDEHLSIRWRLANQPHDGVVFFGLLDNEIWSSNKKCDKMSKQIAAVASLDGALNIYLDPPQSELNQHNAINVRVDIVPAAGKTAITDTTKAAKVIKEVTDFFQDYVTTIVKDLTARGYKATNYRDKEKQVKAYLETHGYAFDDEGNMISGALLIPEAPEGVDRQEVFKEALAEISRGKMSKGLPIDELKIYLMEKCKGITKDNLDKVMEWFMFAAVNCDTPMLKCEEDRLLRV